MEPKDVSEALPFVFDKGMYVAIGALVVWLLKGGGAEKVQGWFRKTKEEIRHEAKEAPETEVRMLREHSAKQDVAIVSLTAKIETLSDAHHKCEVNQARQAEKIEFLEQRNVELQIAVEQLQGLDSDTEKE